MKLLSREVTLKGRKEIYAIQESENLLVMERSGCYIQDKEGKIISKTYNQINEFIDNLAVVEQKNKKGIITSDGKELFKKLWDNASLDGNVIRVCKDGRWGFANSKGKILCKPQFAFIENFNNGYARFETEDQMWGIIDTSGKILVEPLYEFLSIARSKKILAKKCRSYGCIDFKGNIIVPFKYTKIYFKNDYIEIYNNESDIVVV